MKKIYLITDYKNNFGSKYFSNPYRGGMNKETLGKYFEEVSYEAVFIKPTDINFRENNYSNIIFLYTSQEDRGGYYKDYLEDVLYGLDICKAKLIPEFKYMRSHENKVFMNIYADISEIQKRPKTWCFGTLEELLDSLSIIKYPIVIKAAHGAMSKGVFKAESETQLIKIIKKISNTKNTIIDTKDFLRILKHKGYKRESIFRNKFLLEEFIPNLHDDWKVLVYGERYFILNRKNRKNDFRASGSGKFFFRKDIPVGILDFARQIYLSLKVPHISLDIAYDGIQFYLFEYQAIYFGTTTIEKSPFHYIYTNNGFKIQEGCSILEKVYVDSIKDYLEK